MMALTKKILLALFSLMLLNNCATAQSGSIDIGGGIAPLHYAAQSDFSPAQHPYDVFIMYNLRKVGLRLDYTWHSQYRKENFSFTNQTLELSVVYSLRELLQTKRIDPFIRGGITRWRTDFTTEGYPGITDYVLKVETGQGYGAILSGGANYPYKNFAFGMELQYARLGTSGFIAGGFEPQPLLSDHLRVMITAQYRLPITFSSPRGQAVACPTF